MNDTSEILTDVSRWLKQLRLQDYSWASLPKRSNVWSGTSQQDFWRRSATGHNRSDEELISHGYLIDVGNGKLIHVANAYPYICENLDDYFESKEQYFSVLDAAWGEKADEIQRRHDPRFDGIVLHNFKNSVFPSIGSYQMHNCIFIEDNSIYRIEGEILFKECIFLSNVEIFDVAQSVRINNNLKFDSCVFYQDLKIENRTIDVYILFYKSRFYSRLYIESVDFERDLTFDSCGFDSHFLLSSSSVKREFRLTFCHVHGNFGLYDVDFHEDFSALESSLLSDVDVVACRFKGRARFADVTWPSLDIHWANGQETHFEAEVAFSGSPPPPIQLFDDMRFESAVSFPRVGEMAWHEAFRRELVELNSASLEAPDRSSRILQLENGCRALRKLADIDGNGRLEQQWHRCELIARRESGEVGKLERWLSISYGVCADYGISIARPFGILGIVILSFSVFYAAVTSGVDVGAPIDTHSLTQGLGYSLGRTFPFGVFEVTDSAWRQELLGRSATLHSVAVRAIATAQTVLSIILVYLGVMAARRKFKIS